MNLLQGTEYLQSFIQIKVEISNLNYSEMCKLLNIQKTRTTPYNPKSDGMIERLNRTVLQMLSMLVNGNRDGWDDHIPFVMMAYRATCHDSTGFSPNELMFGREIPFPIDVMFNGCQGQVETVCQSQYVEWLKTSLELSLDVAFENLKPSALKQKRAYDVGLKPRKFNADDIVWRWYPPLGNQKLAMGWVGPYKIIERLTDVTYKIEHVDNKKQLVVHVDHLKPYKGGRNFGQEVFPPQNDDSFVGQADIDQTNVSFDHDNADHLPDGPKGYENPGYFTRAGRRVKPKEIISPS